MLRWIYIIELLCLPFALSAQWKTVEKNPKEKPAWVGGAERNYLIVSAEAPTLEEAKEKVLISLKQQVVGTIATHIVSGTEINRQQTTVGKNETDYTEQIRSFVKTRIAQVPFISEISLSKAQGFYWEKQYDKKRKIYRYEYHVKYRFTDFEIQDLVNRFNDRENELNSRLAACTREMDRIESVEQIDRTLRELKTLREAFDPSDPRRTQTEQLSNSYRQLYGFIDLREESHPDDRTLLVALYLNGRRLSSLQKPKLLSNCAVKLSYEIEEGYYRIQYDDTACYDDDENYVEIRFRFGNRITSKKIYLK